MSEQQQHRDGSHTFEQGKVTVIRNRELWDTGEGRYVTKDIGPYVEVQWGCTTVYMTPDRTEALIADVERFAWTDDSPRVLVPLGQYLADEGEVPINATEVSLWIQSFPDFVEGAQILNVTFGGIKPDDLDATAPPYENARWEQLRDALRAAIGDARTQIAQEPADATQVV